MKVTKSQHGAIAILSIAGAVLSEELDTFDAKFEDCISEGIYKIVLDLQNVSFVDSAGLEKILDTASDLGKRGGDLRVSSLNDVCSDIFRTTKMDSLVQVFDDREGALRSLV